MTTPASPFVAAGVEAELAQYSFAGALHEQPEQFPGKLALVVLYAHVTLSWMTTDTPVTAAQLFVVQSMHPQTVVVLLAFSVAPALGIWIVGAVHVDGGEQD
jgi:hypothetical protein